MRTIGKATLVAISFGGAPAAAESPLSDIEVALGGPVIECSGTINWSSSTRSNAPEPSHTSFAVRDAADANRLALYDAHRSFMEENVWPCEAGLCTSSRVTRTGATMNVVRLVPTPEGAQTELLAQWAYVVVSASSDRLVPESLTGEGAFQCNGRVPDAMLADRP
ncbi:hypothetical protein E0K89_002010 [Aquicoccus sp. SCR17]|nr:hypothetical protein [Carideicomes alvinocaridis]